MIVNGFLVTIGVCLALLLVGVVVFIAYFYLNRYVERRQFKEQFIELAPEYIENCLEQQDFEEVLKINNFLARLKNAEKIDKELLKTYWIDTTEAMYADEENNLFYMTKKSFLRKK